MSHSQVAARPSHQSSPGTTPCSKKRGGPCCLSHAWSAKEVALSKITAVGPSTRNLEFVSGLGGSLILASELRRHDPVFREEAPIAYRRRGPNWKMRKLARPPDRVYAESMPKL